MNTAEKIAVMQAFLDGKQIQFYDYGIWKDSEGIPAWDWVYCDYRIKPAEQKKVKLLAWMDADQLFWLKEKSQPKFPSVRVPSEDKEITL